MAKGKPAAGKRKGAPVKVTVRTFPAQANLDWPYRMYDPQGRQDSQEYDRPTKLHTTKGTKKLQPYELHLPQKHFPTQDRKYIADQEKAAQARKQARKAAAPGLNPVRSDDSDAGEATDVVFKRNAANKVLL
jgi:hypothetical protein